MPRVGETRTCKLELRIGGETNPDDGRRGVIVADGEVPEGEFLQWLERLKFRSLPAVIGGVWLYADARLVIGHDQVDAPPPRPATKVSDELSRTNPEAEQLALRLLTLREQVLAEQDRLRRVREDLAELRPHLERERARVAGELERLDRSLSEAQTALSTAKAAYREELTATATTLGGVMTGVATQMHQQLGLVSASFEATLQTMANTNLQLVQGEAAQAISAQARRVEAQGHAVAQLELYDALQEAGAQKLLTASGPGPKAKIYDGFGTWLQTGGINKTMEFVDNLFDKFIAANKKSEGG